MKKIPVENVIQELGLGGFQTNNMDCWHSTKEELNSNVTADNAKKLQERQHKYVISETKRVSGAEDVTLYLMPNGDICTTVNTA